MRLATVSRRQRDAVGAILLQMRVPDPGGKLLGVAGVILQLPFGVVREDLELPPVLLADLLAHATRPRRRGDPRLRLAPRALYRWLTRNMADCGLDAAEDCGGVSDLSRAVYYGRATRSFRSRVSQ